MVKPIPVLEAIEARIRRIKQIGLEFDAWGNPTKFATVQPAESAVEPCLMCHKPEPLVDGQICSKCFNIYEYGENINEQQTKS